MDVVQCRVDQPVSQPVLHPTAHESAKPGRKEPCDERAHDVNGRQYEGRKADTQARGTIANGWLYTQKKRRIRPLGLSYIRAS